MLVYTVISGSCFFRILLYKNDYPFISVYSLFQVLLLISATLPIRYTLLKFTFKLILGHIGLEIGIICKFRTLHWYRRIPYIRPWACTLVAVYCGLIHEGGLIHGGFWSVRIFIKYSGFAPFFMYFNDFWAIWAYTPGGLCTGTKAA